MFDFRIEQNPSSSLNTKGRVESNTRYITTNNISLPYIVLHTADHKESNEWNEQACTTCVREKIRGCFLKSGCLFQFIVVSCPACPVHFTEGLQVYLHNTAPHSPTKQNEGRKHFVPCIIHTSSLARSLARSAQPYSKKRLAKSTQQSKKTSSHPSSSQRKTPISHAHPIQSASSAAQRKTSSSRSHQPLPIFSALPSPPFI